MTPDRIPIPVLPSVAKAIDRLALPGEKRKDTVARIVWAVSTSETKERRDR